MHVLLLPPRLRTMCSVSPGPLVWRMTPFSALIALHVVVTMCGPPGGKDRITVPCVPPTSPPRLPCAILQLLLRTLPTLRATSYAVSWSHPCFFQATALFHPVGQPNNRGVNSLVLSNGLPDPPDPVTLLCFSHVGPPPHVEQSSDRRLEWCPV